MKKQIRSCACIFLVLLLTVLSTAAGWADSCQDWTATNDQHVSAGRAYTQTSSGCDTVITYYAVGSNENLGTSGSTSTTLFSEDNGATYHKGSCPSSGTDCQEYTTTNDQHVSAARAYTESGSSGCDTAATTYYAVGSNENLGTSGSATTTLKTEDGGQSYRQGSCAGTTPEPTSGLYVAPDGNDNNPGTISAPFKSITKAQSVASSGTTVYLRGGTYSGFTIAGSDSNYNFVHNITKSGITYAAYPGETPVFNFSGTTTAKRVAAFHVASGVSVTFIGFHVTGVPVGSNKQSECFRIEGNATFERMTCRDNQANGFYFTTNASGSCTNCDAYNNVGTGESASNTDGFGAHCKGSVTFRYCRAWNCSDDGFDCIATYAPVTFDHCWVYNINNSAGDGNGFKVGGWGSATPPSSVPSHIVRYCLAANIKNSGFYANHHPGKAADWTYNSAYNCGSDFNMLERVSTTNATDIPGTREVLHFNVAYAGTIISNSNLPAANVTNNSWTKSGVSVSAADFQSTDASQITRPRNADGSLPAITFMKLVNGSDLAGMGYSQ